MGIMYYGLGTADVMLAIILIVSIVIVRFWLMKIYMRIRQIALIADHFLKKSIAKKKRFGILKKCIYYYKEGKLYFIKKI